MNSSINNRHSLSLIQTISAIFITMTLLVVLLSITSLKSIDKVGLQFSGLSEQTLPLALNNARLTQNILEQVQSLGDGIRTTESAELEAVNQQLSHLNQQTDQLTDQLFSIATRIGNAITQDHQVSLRSKSAAFQQLTYSILSTQASLLEQQNAIDNAATAFRYGLSSIGPEMNRISSFLALDNPESMDAANRFIASASSMESTFLLLMMQNDPEQAKVQFKEIRNRMAGIELAFDDFKEWHPDVMEFASLTAPYEMVKAGFVEHGILALILNKIEQAQQQRQEMAQAAQLAKDTVALLNTISATASELIKHSENVVHDAMLMVKQVQYTGALWFY